MNNLIKALTEQKIDYYTLASYKKNIYSSLKINDQRVKIVLSQLAVYPEQGETIIEFCYRTKFSGVILVDIRDGSYNDAIQMVVCNYTDYKEAENGNQE